MSEAVDMIAEERAPVTKQTEIGATYDPMCNKPAVTKLNLQQPARKIHDFIRGLDSVPGAWTLLDGKETKLFGSKLWHGVLPTGTNVNLEGAAKPGIVHENGLLVFGNWYLTVDKDLNILVVLFFPYEFCFDTHKLGSEINVGSIWD